LQAVSRLGVLLLREHFQNDDDQEGGREDGREHLEGVALISGSFDGRP
jgi:hypothetical protein